MKRIIILLLVLSMSLTLVACSGDGIDTVIEEADKLLAEGDYVAALDTLNAADEYSKLIAKINATRLSQLQAEKGNILGTWINTEGTTMVTFRDDFTGTITNLDNNIEQTLDYEVTNDGRIYVTYPYNMKLSIAQEDNIVKLVNETATTTFVTEADYVLFAPEIIELTLDNWQDYFELREAIDLYSNEFGELQHFSIGYGLFLKDEFIPRLKNLENVSFELEAERFFRTVEVDEASGAYTTGDALDYNWDWHPDGQSGTFSATVWDRTKYTSDDPRSSSYQQVCGTCTDGMSTYEGDVEYHCVLENATLTRIQGTIELAK